MCGNVPVYKMKYKNSLFQLFVLDIPFQSITDVVNRMFYREKKILSLETYVKKIIL